MAVVLITCAGSGIGRLTAETLACEGHILRDLGLEFMTPSVVTLHVGKASA